MRKQRRSSKITKQNTKKTIDLKLIPLNNYDVDDELASASLGHDKVESTKSMRINPSKATSYKPLAEKPTLEESFTRSIEAKMMKNPVISARISSGIKMLSEAGEVIRESDEPARNLSRNFSIQEYKKIKNTQDALSPGDRLFADNSELSA